MHMWRLTERKREQPGTARDREKRDKKKERVNRVGESKKEETQRGGGQRGTDGEKERERK